jgi:hypothetical protein
MENERQELLMKTQTKLDNWAILKLPVEEQVQWFKDTVVPSVAAVSANKDRVEEIIVVENLLDVASEAMQDCQLPADFPDQKGVSREQLANDFKNYCKEIMVRGVPVDQMVLVEDVAEDYQFIRLISFNARKNHFLQHWDNQLGVTRSLAEKGIAIIPTPEQLEQMFLFVHVIQCATEQQSKLVQASQQEAQMFQVGQ